MKTILLSLSAIALATGLHAQIASDSFDDGDVSNITIGGNFTVAENGGNLEISTTGGHDEWKFVSYNFASPITITETDTIRLVIKAEVDQISGIMPVLTVMVEDTAGVSNNNQAMQDQRATLTTAFKTYDFYAGDFFDEWVSQNTIDGSAIARIWFSPNRGFGSFPYTNANGDDINSFYTGTITIQSLEVISSTTASTYSISEPANFQLYPNPSSGNIKISMTGEEGTAMRITDLLGNEVHKQMVSSNVFTQQIDVKLPGVYFLTLMNGGTTYTHKFIVK